MHAPLPPPLVGEELYTPERFERLVVELGELGAAVDPELGWKAYACSLLAEELAEPS